MKEYSYKEIGFLQNIVICIYDFMLVFSVLFFMSVPVHIFTDGEAIINNMFYKIYLLFIVILYYSWFWIKHNQTLGMKAWKTYLVNDNQDNKIKFSQTILRIVVSILGGHILLLFNSRSLHDIVSKTRIIKKEKLS
tara:strand:- start:589 stop:996 length:408 start_codon:yes stop_codon:yes gene_type:complete